MSAVLNTDVTPATERAAATFAAEMQRTLVPPLHYRGESIEACGQCIPKDEVGGDLMDLVADGPDVIAYVADVSGHGLRAGVLMGMVKTAMRYGLLLGRPLSHLVSDLNRILPQVKQPGMFATLAALRFDGSSEAEYVSAGHVPVLHFRKKTGGVIRHYAQHCPLGLLARDAYESRRIGFEAGDIFLLLTDGAVELGEERDAEAGLEVLAQTVCQCNRYPLAEILESLRSEIGRQGAPHDDRTLLLVRAPGGSGTREQLSRGRLLRDHTCCDLAEARWHKVLSGLAAGLADD